jgi:ribosomal subunit interface protein
MNKNISFKNMDHSQPLESHAMQKLQKIEEFFDSAEKMDPLKVELHLKANKKHPHHSVELHLKTPSFDLNSHDEGTDMYVVIDNTVDKMVKLLKKEKAKKKDKIQKVDNEKKTFSSDKYKL